MFEIKNTSVQLCAKNAGGGRGLCMRGGIFAGHAHIKISRMVAHVQTVQCRQN